jgi:hypothetical protein
MKLPVIKKLVETASMEQLSAAEDAILNELPPAIDVEGIDDGEKLTHLMAAQFILNEMGKGVDYPTAMRTYTAKVRTSIS